MIWLLFWTFCAAHPIHAIPLPDAERCRMIAQAIGQTLTALGDAGVVAELTCEPTRSRLQPESSCGP